jgi:uncharacterized protein (TIGR03032 family)
MERRQPDVPDVFISYAGFDRDLAAALAVELEAADVPMWWDALLTAEESFEQQIQRILAGTRIVAAILSPQALASEWVRWELSQASQNGLHIVPVLVNGARSPDLPPPLHLLPSLSLPDGGGRAFMQHIATQIHGLLTTIKRRPPRANENDARRRLASAAATIARQAADIKQRKANGAARPPIVTGRIAHAEEPAARYSTSEGLSSFLRDQNIAIAFTSFQTGQLFLVGRTATGEISVDVQAFRKPTGLCAAGDALVVATLGHVYRLENILRPGQSLDGTYSHCYLPRVGHLTGVLDTHDVGVDRSGAPVFVATRYNCLATTSPVHGFKPVWRPPFISELVAEDRCHLNGLAMREGAPAYATAVSASNTYDGWRDRFADGGVVVDVVTNEIVCDALSMPHSPRMQGNELWLLSSGAGELGYVVGLERERGRFQAVSFSPGFVRGLAFHRQYALVGLSRPRYDDGFAGLALQRRLEDAREEAWCGVQIIDTASGRCAEWFRIDGPTREIFDVAVLPGVLCPRSVSPLDDEALDLVTAEL